MIYGPNFDRFIAFLYQAGGSVLSEDRTQITIDSEQTRQALEYYYGLYRDGLAAAPGDVGAAWPGDAFAKDLGAIVFEGPWLLPFMVENNPEKQYQVVEMPAGPAGQATMAFTVAWGINARTSVPDAAWQVISYLTGAEGMQAWTTSTGLLPARQALVDAYNAAFPDRTAFLAGAAYAHPFQFGRGGLKFNNDANQELQGLFAEQMDVDETVTRLAERAAQDIRLT